ncbi:BMC domain-containing protein [Clostridium algidicarnis]|uniref:BMC domain-containing protein n=1 Tax=Clostridium algidicarnis TaxID=37659 RepID=A0ABS6C1T6_9CLOT|nr:BMC domain-containing protein [Clostridium algidicarnis]MBB6631339.1 BMC domain-containing protein [Clostridium algidicarnis]MBB6697182.1 BMC domain-containing protein [Clostridium algidicarnis]MBU3204454.1 BMC domain-containing protein [Clostridium algidicarnis]MBU3212463.1 BMC domain-containing protein [Clostridium algidicarnis]MBU3219429.1 BMC domain-containing protein [Clostridium algidicarnis]
MKKALGILEFSSISRGIEVSDVLLKASFVDVEMIKHICPGKFLTIISGDVEAVKEAMEKAKAGDQKKLVEDTVIPNASEEIIKAFKKRPIVVNFNAIGIMEFLNVTSALKALDIALKASDTQIVKLVLGNGIAGKAYFIINGSVSSVEEGIKSAKANINPNKIIHSSVIPSPNEILLGNL